MSRAQRRHQQTSKKSYTGWIVLAVFVVAAVGLYLYNHQGGSDFDYSPYTYKDEAYAAPNAKIVVEEYSDFQCPACRAFEPTLAAVRKSYPDQVRLVYKQFPLTQIHQYAQGAAEASECAREQDRFWAYHDVLFDSQLIDRASLTDHAEGLGLDMERWQSCMKDGRAKTAISLSVLEGTQRGVQGTPTVYVNGTEFPGRSVSDFEALLK